MTNNPYSFGHPSAGDILSNLYGKGDKAVYARATLDNRLYIETNGGPVELITVGCFYKACRDDNAAAAIYSLSSRLIDAGREEEAEFIAGNLALSGLGDLAKSIADKFALSGRDDLAKFVKCVIDKWCFKRAAKSRK